MPGERIGPLRSHDPRTLGSYRLVGRLGEGGMGTVYLATTEAGASVAVKVVRADLAPDDEFRRRFRSEVARARQVPPFCTAEVLDADPDHERPYLVVEYVDGPTLADVVEERGPLTAANLHSVAIGVATALTAIHGAGVIHRDLKPRNVLLAPGSPKVIDFGIARAMEGPGENTAPDQMMGTVAYMAPERFGDAPLTPAADVFAWGGVVAYAGTGRTPFGGDSPPATAGRILTREPDLSGLTGPLRDLVAEALAKEPADRPTARDLLDRLISGPQRPAATAAALDDQPGLREAAREAQAVTGLDPDPAGPEQVGPEQAGPEQGGSERGGSERGGSVRGGSERGGSERAGPEQVGPEQVGPEQADPEQADPEQAGSERSGSERGGAERGGSERGGLERGGSERGGLERAGSERGGLERAGSERGGLERAGLERAGPGRAEPGEETGAAEKTGLVGYDEDSIITQQVFAAALFDEHGATVRSPMMAGPPSDPRRPWFLPFAVAVLVLTVATGAGIFVLAPLLNRSDAATVTDRPPDLADDLLQARLWQPTRESDGRSVCDFEGALTVRVQQPGLYKCRGPQDDLPRDLDARVNVRLLTPGACAAVWFRFAGNRGYQLRVCRSSIYLGTHKSKVVDIIRTFPLDSPLEVGGTAVRIGLTAVGGTLDVTRDGTFVGTVPLTDPEITGNRLLLGIYTDRNAPSAGPFSVAFDHIEVRDLAKR